MSSMSSRGTVLSLLLASLAGVLVSAAAPRRTVPCLLLALLSPGLVGAEPDAGSIAPVGATALPTVALRLVEDLDVTDAPHDFPCMVEESFCARFRYGSSPSQLTTVGDRVYFAADDRAHGAEVWVSDGTAEGTELVADLCPGPCGADPRIAGRLGDRIVFCGVDGEHGQGTWIAGGGDPPLRLADVCAGGVRGEPGHLWIFAGDSGRIGPQDPDAGVLYFRVQPSLDEHELWATDGTPLGTRELPADCSGGCSAAPGPSRFGAEGLYVLHDGGLHWVAASGGPAHAVFAVGTVDGATVAGLVAHAGGVLLLVRVGERGWELWFAGDEAGPRRLAVLPESSRMEIVSSRDRDGWVADGRLRVLVWRPDVDAALWVTDGTVAGTRRLAELPDFAASPVWYRGSFYYVASDPEPFRHLVRGYDPATGRRFDLDLGSDGVRSLKSAVDRLFVEVLDDLWVSDGTDALVARVVPPPIQAADGFDFLGHDHLVEARGRLFLAAQPTLDGERLVPPGWELYALDAGSLATSALHLQGGKYRAVVRRGIRSPFTPRDEATAVPVTDASGFFWFFRPENLELVVKVLDGSEANGHDWVFWGGITDLDYELEVTNLETGESRFYEHEKGDLCGGSDTAAFAHAPSSPALAGLAATGSVASPSSADRMGEPGEATSAGSPVRVSAATTAGVTSPYGPCPAEALCLGEDGRFAARVRWTNQYAGGVEGIGHPVAETDRSGWFWFFRPHNLEVMVKVLDGTSINGHFWVFTGGLTTVERRLEVTDRATGTTRTYHHPPGSSCGRADTTAFPAL